MSQIGGVSSSVYSTTQQQVIQNASAAEFTQRPQGSGVNPEQHLQQALSEAGIDSETSEAIQEELKALFEESFSSNEGRPDDSLKEKVDSVFENYGLDASEILGQPGAGRPSGPPPGGPPPGGPPPSSNDESTTTDESSTDESELLSLIESLAEEESDPKKLAELVVDALYGLDETA